MGTFDERHDDAPHQHAPHQHAATQDAARRHDPRHDARRLDLQSADEVIRMPRAELLGRFSGRMRGHHAFMEVAAGTRTIPDEAQYGWMRVEYRNWQAFMRWQAALCACNAPAPRDDLERAARAVAGAAYEASWAAFLLTGDGAVGVLPISEQQALLAGAATLRDGVQELLHALVQRTSGS